MKNKEIFLFLIIFMLFNSCYLLKETVSDSLYVYNYQPFADGTKAVKLSETSTLKLYNNLPKIDGATALYPLYASFVQAVYPEDEYPPYKYDVDLKRNISLISVSRTPEAYRRLINKEVDLIFCAKPSIQQIETAREKGMEFKMTPIGREAFVFFVHKNNHVSNLTTDDIIKIYSGEIVNWSKLGGRNIDIKAYQREKNSGSQTILESIMGDVKIIEPLKENVMTFMLDIVNQTADYRNYRTALGYSFLFYTTKMVQNGRIKLLSINNISPSIETIQNGTYPYVDEFYAITTDTDNENVNIFIEWILSAQGQYLVEKTGYVPIR